MIHAGTDSYYPFHANTHNTRLSVAMYSPHIKYIMYIAVFLMMLLILRGTGMVVFKDIVYKLIYLTGHSLSLWYLCTQVNCNYDLKIECISSHSDLESAHNNYCYFVS